MKRMKKVFAMLLAFAMVMGMSMTSFAAITGSTITVKGLSTEAEQEVKIYEIYRLDDNNNLWVLSDWAKNAKDDDNNAIMASEADLANPSKIAELAKDVPTTPVDSEKSSNGSVTFTNLQAGAYLVIATDSLNKTTYAPMVAVTYAYDAESHLLVATSASVVAKADGYKNDKTYSDTDGVVEVGDLVTYTITTTVPYIAENAEVVTFKLNDNLENATYFFSGTTAKGENGTLSVKVGSTDVNVNAFAEEFNGETSFELNLGSYVSAENEYAGQKVVVTYTALVDADADEISNTVGSEWAEEVDTIVKTGQITITKFGEAEKTVVDGEEKVTYPVLEGAEFVLYNEDGKYAVVNNGYVSGWVADINQATKLVTAADGTVTVKGLDVGEYSFKEITAPDGYSINTTDVSDEITKDDLEANAEMYDTKLSALPATGGMGTAVFTIGGCAIMVVAAYFFLANRKKES